MVGQGSRKEREPATQIKDILSDYDSGSWCGSVKQKMNLLDPSLQKGVIIMGTELLHGVYNLINSHKIISGKIFAMGISSMACLKTYIIYHNGKSTCPHELTHQALA